MDIIKQFKKVNIHVKHDNGYFLFTMPDKSIKRIKKLDVERYLFICLLDYVNDEEI